MSGDEPVRASGFDLAAGPDIHVEALRVGNGPFILLDSEEGIRKLLEWARAHRFVLNGYHEGLARKYGVPTGGVMFSRPMPIVAPINWLNEEQAAEIWPKADQGGAE